MPFVFEMARYVAFVFGFHCIFFFSKIITGLMGGRLIGRNKWWLLFYFLSNKYCKTVTKRSYDHPAKKIWLCTLEIVCYRGLHLCLFQLPFFRFLLISKLWLNTACVEKLERWRKSYFWIDLNHVARFGSTKTSLDRF